MIWFFERQQRRLHYEIRLTDGDGYEIVINHPDGRTEVERFSDPVDLLARSASLRLSLMNDGWTQPSATPRMGRSASPSTTASRAST